jgi:CYTH domain-containing protein
MALMIVVGVPMPQRRFLIASSFARLIRKERGTMSRVVEGYFPAHPDRDHFVSIEPDRSFLILASTTQETALERTEVPRSQAEALMGVCTGKAGFERTSIRLPDGREAVLDHFVAPGLLDVVSVEFAEAEASTAFIPPAWFGPEVTHDAAYRNGALAREGLPAAAAFPLSSPMLDDLLTALDAQAGAGQVSPEHLPLAEDADASKRNSHHAGDEPSSTPPALDERAQVNGVLTGLEKALEGMVTPEPGPETGGAPIELSRPRAEVRRWRRPA